MLIVAGVLVALAANSAWESWRDRGRERVYLVQLLADTHENAVRIGAAIAEDSALEASTRRWTRLLRSTGPVPPEDSIPSSGGGPGRMSGLITVARGREDVLLPMGAAAAARGRRLKVLRSLRTESQALETLLRTELAAT